MIEVVTLPPERWREARDLRLRALKTDPIAFGSSFEEEENFSEAEWQRRMGNALFAVSDNKLVGSVAYQFSDRIKVRHITRIFGVYVDQNHRGKGVGKKLLERALELIRQNKDIAKVQLMVNQEQEVAVESYKRIGFIVVGKLKKEIKVNDVFYDELVMEKMLLF